MALRPRSPSLCKAQAAHPQRGNPQEAGNRHATQVRWLPLWRDDYNTLAQQRNQGLSQGLFHNQAGGCVSVNQMASTEVGFFAQTKGKLTKRRYRCATIFVDLYSRLRFVDLQIDDSSAETLAAVPYPSKVRYTPHHHGGPNTTLTAHPTRIPPGGSPSSSRCGRRG
jgi:hypothetical protein